MSKTCAGVDGESCAVELGDGNRSGLCTRHYARKKYREKHPKQAERAPKRRSTKRVDAAPGRSVSVQLTEAQLDTLILALPLEVKARLLASHLGQ